MVTSPTAQIQNVPFTHEHFLLGSYQDFMQDRLGFLSRLAQEGDVRGFRVGPITFLFFNTSEYAQQILVEDASAFSKGKLMHKAVGNNGLFISEGNFHRQQRKLMAPSFQPRHIVSYANTIVSYGTLITQEWKENSVIDIDHEMTRLTMSIIGKVLFDTEFLSEADELGAAINTGLAHAVRTITSPLMLPLSIPTPYNQRVRQAIHTLDSRLLQMIEERRQHANDDRNDLLSHLLRARDDDGRPMSDQQLVDECVTLFTAGHETTAAALTWTWYLLCKHPEIYRKVQQEVDRELQGRVPTFDDLSGLPYCLQVFKEAMRLYPPAAGILREAMRDIVIGSYRVPKGATVMISPYTLHRRAETFPDPEIFQPERFEPSREKLLPRSAYIPFGAGPRICIGNHFALMEGHLLIALIAQRFSFSLVPGQHIEPDIVHHLVLRPGGEVNLNVHAR